MAFGDGSIGTSSGIGQGLAYILPQSRSEEYALRLAQDESKLLASQAAAKLKRQQQEQDMLNKQFTSQKLPALWSPYNKIVSDNMLDWQQKASTYNANTGKSPFMNPELMNDYNTRVNGIATQSKDLGDNYGKLYSAAVGDAGNKYTLDSVKQVLDAEQDISKNPMAYIDGSKRLPELKLQPASFEDFSKLVKPTPVSNDNGSLKTVRADRSAHIDQTLNTLMSNPDKWAGMAIKEFGVDLTKPTYPVLGQNGRKIYPTNEATVSKLADNILNGQNGVAELATFGIDPNDEFAKEKLVDAIKKQNQGIGQILTRSADLADSKVPKSTDVSYENERMNMARGNYQMARTRFNERNKKDQDQAVLYRQKLVGDMLSGVPGSGETLKGIVSAIPEYSGNLDIVTKDNEDEITFIVPAQVKSKIVNGEPKTEAIPGRKVTIKKNEPGARSQLNRLISEISGENIPESRFQTGNASGKIKTPEKTTTTKMVTMILPNGQTGEIPEGSVADFIKQYPQAKRQ